MQHLEYLAWHHHLFQHVPTLLLAEKNEQTILKPFLAWAKQNKLSMDWTLHIHLLDWLFHDERYAYLRSGDLVESCLKGACIRWLLSGLEHVNIKGMMMASPYLRGIGIGIKKSDAIDGQNKIVHYHLPNHTRFTEVRYALFTLHVFDFNTEWLVIPR